MENFRRILYTRFWRLNTHLTSHKTKNNYINEIQEKALNLANQRKLPYSFTIIIGNLEGKQVISISNIHLKNLEKRAMTERNIVIPIELYSLYLMAPKDELFLSIFHEYGHFIYHFLPKNSGIKDRMYELWLNKKLPHFYDNEKLDEHEKFEEDLAENFARYIIGGDLVYNFEITSLFRSSVKIVEILYRGIFRRLGN